MEPDAGSSPNKTEDAESGQSPIIVRSSTTDLRKAQADGSATVQSSPKEAIDAGSKPRRATYDLPTPRRATYDVPTPRRETDERSGPRRATYAASSPSGTTEAILRPRFATEAESSSIRPATTESDQSSIVKTSSIVVLNSDKPEAAAYSPKGETDAGSKPRRATYAGSSPRRETDAESSPRRATYAGYSPSRTTEAISRPGFATDAESSPRKSATTGSDQSSVIFIGSFPRRSSTTGSGQSSATGAESTQTRPITSGSDQRSAVDTESTARRATHPGSDSTRTRRRPKAIRSSQRRSIAIGTDDVSSPPADGSTSIRPTTTGSDSRRAPDFESAQRRSTAVGTELSQAQINESAARRSTDMWSDPSWLTFAQYAVTSSRADLSSTQADESADAGSSPRRVTYAGSIPGRETHPRSSPMRATYSGFSPMSETDATSSSREVTYARSSPSMTIDPISRPSLSTDARSTPRRPTYAGSSPRRGTYTISTPRRATDPEFRQIGETYIISPPRRATDPEFRQFGETYTISPARSATDPEFRQTGETYVTSTPRTPSSTEFIPSWTPATDTESSVWPSATGFTPSRRLTTSTPPRRVLVDEFSQSTVTAEVGSPVRSNVTEVESAEQVNEWALNDLSVYQLTVKSLVVAVLAGLQFSSGSNGEGGIYCSHKEGCIWHNKPQGTIGVDFQLDIISMVAAFLSSISMFIGLSRVPGENSCWYLIPWLLLVTFSLQKFHIAAILNLLAFLTTCSHVTAIFLMILCVVLFYLEINVFYEVFLCAWHLHDDPTLK